MDFPNWEIKANGVSGQGWLAGCWSHRDFTSSEQAHGKETAL